MYNEVKVEGPFLIILSVHRLREPCRAIKEAIVAVRVKIN